MRHFLFVLAEFAISATLLAQSSILRNKVSDDSVSAPCSVTGRVVAAADGNPLKSARVILAPPHFPSDQQMYATSSDIDGRFTIKDVPAGRYNFLVSRSGFVTQFYKAGNDDVGPLFLLHPGEKVGDVLFRLIATAVITGRITNEDGDGIEHVPVVALRRPDYEPEDEEEARYTTQLDTVATAESDDRGQYRIFGLKPGEYYIRAEHSRQESWVNESLDSAYASLYFPGVAHVSDAQLIPVKGGEEAQADIVMHREKTVEIAGHVVGTNGPLAYAGVSLIPTQVSDLELQRHGMTDEKGSFRLKNIPEGSYYVTVHTSEEGSAWQKVEVAGENIDSLTINLGTGVTIRGKVKIDCASSVALDRISIGLTSIDQDSLSSGHAEPKKDGTFEMKFVSDGNYSLSVSEFPEPKFYVKSARFGPDDVLQKGVQVESGSPSLGNLDLVISSDGAQLDGVVTDEDNPIIGARVRLAPDPLTPYNHLRSQRTVADQLGHFSLANIAPGKYTLTAKVSSKIPAYKLEAQTLTFMENEHKTIALKLEKEQK